MIIRSATPDELPVVTALLEETARWLHRRGVDQWPLPLARTDRITANVKNGDTWLLIDHHIAAATVTLDEYGDPEFWDDHDPGDALYMHKMAVARAYAGHGLGARLLDWSADQAHTRGKTWLRWDAWKSNQRLQDYYRSVGGQHVRTVDLAHRDSGALFQIPARPASEETQALIREAN